ncbi:hypothetical protein N657DRAFT_646806 [Parathielavia appendiculata]|uniref:Uncharacterized protein n=1 Tax=Parathielavia appendiculata TaxID=2587402 RepID=A0AAN6TWR4_9PEZI|nr:hypothetical protein N657DRAFT_646806 [Parathielavia appendiculata]
MYPAGVVRVLPVLFPFPISVANRPGPRGSRPLALLAQQKLRLRSFGLDSPLRRSGTVTEGADRQRGQSGLRFSIRRPNTDTSRPFLLVSLSTLLVSCWEGVTGPPFSSSDVVHHRVASY